MLNITQQLRILYSPLVLCSSLVLPQQPSGAAGNKTFLPCVLLVKERSHLFWGGGGPGFERDTQRHACQIKSCSPHPLCSSCWGLKINTQKWNERNKCYLPPLFYLSAEFNGVRVEGTPRGRMPQRKIPTASSRSRKQMRRYSLQCWSGPSASMRLGAEASSYMPKFAHRTE